MRDDRIADLPMSDQLHLILTRQLTSTRLVELYLDRISRYDGGSGLNSYISVVADSALHEAEAADALLKAGKPTKGPLHGLPVALKDNIETKGIRTTGGSRILADWVPPQDAWVVKRLRRAGAVILGKTNMHELALGTTTNNPHYGPAHNPYDPGRIAGGSSGGSAVATAAGLCSASIGTDTGGSVRIPAAFCGVVGLRPTTGRVGRSGVVPLSFTRDTVGPITRTVRDSAMLLEAIAGKDPGDPCSASRPIPRWTEPSANNLKGKRFGLPKKFIVEMIDADMEKAMNDGVEVIRERGGIVAEIDLPHLDLAPAADFNVVIAEAVCLLDEYFSRVDPRWTVQTLLHQMGTEVGEILGRQIATNGAGPVSGHLYLRTLRNECEAMKSAFRETMRNLDCLLLPTTPTPAPRIGEEPEMEVNGQKVSLFTTNVRNCVPLSIVGYPAISVPAGYSRTGLPLGLQLVARPWEEENLLAIAYAFEQATKVRKPPRLEKP